MDILILFALILLSAIISAAEIGFFSVNETRLRALAEGGGKRAAMALYLRSNPQRLLSTIMIGDNLVNAGAAAFATIVTIRLFGSEALAVAIGILTFVLMIFGDVVPKTLAAKHAVPLVLAMAYPVYWIEWVLQPVLFVLEPMIDKITGGKGLTVPFVTEEELKIMLDVGGKAGAIESEEVKMIKNVFQLNDITAEDAMTPRIYVFALDGNLRLKEAQDQLFQSKYSRIPVYDGTLDNITGILYKNKALIELAQGHSDVKLKDIAQPALFVPRSKPADDLMKQFQQEKRHMAIVVNEFGGVMGLVTLEDLLEEVVGEIMDETDITEELIKRIGKNQILVHGRTEVRKINDFLKVDLGDEANTVSGLIQEQLGRIPAVGEELRVGNCRLVVHEADPKSIKSVQIFKEEKAGVTVESSEAARMDVAS
ncbi:MAG TPA: hemolysin family protein [Nitrospiraceae bacterium]|jgi:CBS domain containing-hemolysin-like protein|nr:hemolysin family protein [Nitrospiraceae bacterium]